MGCKTIPEQLAIALGKDTLNNSDQFPVVENDTLYRTTIGDLATSLGLTGVLQAVGGGTTTPILTGTAPNYSIRGVIGAQGISASLNALGSVTISGQFKDAGSTLDGEGLIKNRTASTIEFRRLKAGNGITITQESNSLIIDNDQVAPDNNTVLVNQLSDFPAPAGGAITLADGTNYLIANDLSTSNRFIFGTNTVITASDPFVTTLAYTGVGNMFTFVNGAVGISNIGITCANGTLFDTTAVTAGQLFLRDCLFNEIKNLGTINTTAVGMYNCFLALHTGQGFTVGAVADKRINIQNFTVVNSTDAASTFLDLDAATYSAFTIDNVSFLGTVAGQTFLKGATGGANLNDGIVGFVSGVTINGDMAALNNISVNDPNWDFTDNNKISDTRPVALMTLSAPATTTIVLADTPVIVNGVFTDQESSLFTVGTDGVVTYNGVRPLGVGLTSSITFLSSSGTNNYAFYVAKNGVPIVASEVTKIASATVSVNISLLWDVQVTKNDTLSVWVANLDNTNDVSAVTMVTRIK